MTVAVQSNGSQSCTINTQHTLATITDANVYQLVLDLSALQGGSTPDELEIHIFGKAGSSDTERRMDFQMAYATQYVALWRSMPILSPHYVRFMIRQTAGTGRTIPWAVYQGQ